MKTKLAPRTDDAAFCGIVFISCGGSSWHYGPTPEDAAKKAARVAKQDWKHLYKFKRGATLNVAIIDMKDHDGWYADHRGVFDCGTEDPIPFHSFVKVTI